MDDEKALLFIREEIDSIDSELISLLESRLNLSLQIGKLKKKMDKDLYDEEREAEILKEEKTVLEDLIKAALNQAKEKVEEMSAEEMKKITGGIPLPPGMKMPF